MSMSRSRGLTVLLTIVAWAAVPTVAQAVSLHWYAGRNELPRGGAPLPVTGNSKHATVRLLTGAGAGQSVKCKAVYSGEIWNPAPTGAGEDRVNSMTFSACKSTPVADCTVNARELPWQSVLAREYPNDEDRLEAVQLEVSCPSSGSSLIEGALQGHVGKVISLKGLFESGLSSVEAEVELPIYIRGGGAHIHARP